MPSLLSLLHPLSLSLLSVAPAAPTFEVRPIAPVQAPDAPARLWDKPPHRHTVYLNFDGAALTQGSNAAEWEAPCLINGVVEYPPFSGTEEQRLAIVDVFTAAVAPFGIRVVHEAAPPRHLPYSMIMVGGLPSQFGQGQSSSAACSFDCGDSWWRETGFVFADPAPGDSVYYGQAAVKVAGHHWGLDVLENYNAYMSAFTSSDPRSWSDGCEFLDDIFGPPQCNSVHEEFCGEGSGQQDDVAELMAMFGADSIDDVAPTVQLLAPSDGAELTPDQDFTVEVDVSDNFDGAGWKLTIPEVGLEVPAYQRETEWVLKAPAGVYTIRVEALDHDGNVGFDEVTIHVGVAPEPEDTTTGEPESTTGEPESTTDAPTTGGAPTETSGDVPEATSDDASTDGATAGGSAPDDEAQGCACAADEGPGDAAPGLLLVLALWFRRRASLA